MNWHRQRIRNAEEEQQEEEEEEEAEEQMLFRPEYARKKRAVNSGCATLERKGQEKEKPDNKKKIIKK